MRTLMKVSMEITAGNAAIKNGSLPLIIKETMDRIKPECAYFYAEKGTRTALMVFDLKDVSEIPSIAEPLFLNFNAKVDFTPIMNADEMQRGVKASIKAQYATVQ